MMKLGINQYSDLEAPEFQLLFAILSDTHTTTKIHMYPLGGYQPDELSHYVMFRYEVEL